MPMTVRDRMLDYYFNPETQEPMCAGCAHFRMHYRQDGVPFGLGHCVYPRIKNRYAYDVCERYKQAPQKGR